MEINSRQRAEKQKPETRIFPALPKKKGKEDGKLARMLRTRDFRSFFMLEKSVLGRVFFLPERMRPWGGARRNPKSASLPSRSRSVRQGSLGPPSPMTR